MYRVIEKNGIIREFNSYGEAIQFKWKNGGTLYQKIGTYEP